MNLKDKLSLIYANPFVSGIVLNSAGTLILLVLAVVLMKVLTVDEYGEFSLIYSIVTILAIIVTLGRDTGSVYYSKNYSLLGYKKNFFYEELLLTSLLSVLLVFILMLVGDEFVSFFNKNFDINLIITAFIIIPFWVAFNLLTSFLRSTSRYKSYFIWTGLYQRLSRLAFVVGFLYFVGGVESVLYGMILSQIFLVSTLTYLERDFFFTVKKINLKRFAFKFKYSFFLSIQSVTVILMEKVDVLTIGVLGTTSNVAVYSVAALVSTTLLLPYFVASKYIEPQLRKISGKMPRVEKKIVVYTTLVFLLGNLIFFILGAK